MRSALGEENTSRPVLYMVVYSLEELDRFFFSPGTALPVYAGSTRYILDKFKEDSKTGLSRNTIIATHQAVHALIKGKLG